MSDDTNVLELTPAPRLRRSPAGGSGRLDQGRDDDLRRDDHASAAKEVGLDLPATVVVIYGNPKGGTPVMQEFPNAALDLPLRVLVREASPECAHGRSTPTLPRSCGS